MTTFVVLWILCGVLAVWILTRMAKHRFNKGFKWGYVIPTIILGPLVLLAILFTFEDEDWKKYRKEV